MDLSDVKNKEAFSAIIINELKTFGVKYQKEKKRKVIQNHQYKKIFRTHLHLLDLTDVILVNGRVVQIPKFVAEACNRILEQVETEGIFRKAGSFARQKEMRISLEAGVALGKSHHVIDVANVVKYFFRELPEPLIPPAIQETLLRSLLVAENYDKAILLACLLLPPLTVNTLSFFTQFLYTVSLSENLNKMSVENLAIIFTPGLMPFSNTNTDRFANHVKIVKILIENANNIGTVPRSIENKLQVKTPENSFPEENGSNAASAKKKKKRRSDMFNGIKKIVGSAMGSSEYLDCSSSDSQPHKSNRNAFKEKECIMATPCLKENKKRKFAESNCNFSAKKKRDFLSLLPSNSGGFLPNTPITKESKKSRLSLGGGRHIKTISLNPVVTSMERRWSIVGSGWSKTKNRHVPDKMNYRSGNGFLDIQITEDKNMCPAILNTIDFELECSQKVSEKSCDIKNAEDNICDDSDCIKISKTEYEEIKGRVAAIESHISHEFGSIRSSRLINSPISPTLSGPEHVQTKYEQMIVKTESLTSPGTEQLAQRLSRGLNIRRSIDQRVIRSPSARKIGTIRRRSQDKIRGPRNSSWHIRSSNIDMLTNETIPSSSEVENTANHVNPPFFYNKNAQKNQSQQNTCNANLSLVPPKKYKNTFETVLSNECSNEHWMSGEVFFCDTKTKETIYNENLECFRQTHVEHVTTTPISRINCFNTEKTLMLPPKSLPRKLSNVRTPLNSAMKPSTTSKLPFVSRIVASTPADEEISGRASIARLRTQNAGMVMAKAKLFDGLENSSCNERRTPKATENQNSDELLRKRNSINVKCQTKPSENVKSINVTPSIEKKDVHIMECKSKATLNTIPIAKRIQNTNTNSPASSSKRRQRVNSFKYSQKQFIKSIVVGDELTIRRNFNERPLNCDKGINLNSNICRNAKSPRRVKKSRQQLKLRHNSSGFQCKNP